MPVAYKNEHYIKIVIKTCFENKRDKNQVFKCAILVHFRANIIEPYIKSKNVKVSEKTFINLHQKG